MSYKEWREQFLEENRLQAQKRKDELMADWWVECMEQARAEVQLQQPPATPSDAGDADESGGVWAHVKREQVKEEVVDDEDDDDSPALKDHVTVVPAKKQIQKSSKAGLPKPPGALINQLLGKFS